MYPQYWTPGIGGTYQFEDKRFFNQYFSSFTNHELLYRNIKTTFYQKYKLNICITNSKHYLFQAIASTVNTAARDALVRSFSRTITE